MELLDRRFRALEAAAHGQALDAAALGAGPQESALARRVLRPLEARWDDGDENLVRGTLDAWVAGEHSAAVSAERLLRAAGELARIEARPSAWWFLLWEMESVLPALVGERGR